MSRVCLFGCSEIELKGSVVKLQTQVSRSLNARQVENF